MLEGRVWIVRKESGSLELSLTRRNTAAKCNAQNSAAVKLIIKASQWRKIGTPGRRRRGRGALYLRIASFADTSEGQSFVPYTVSIHTLFFISNEGPPTLARCGLNALKYCSVTDIATSPNATI
ncbi:hypothetical protein EVAR_93944_1 [Eumeta japonica]|uniref:Uncharacterized protein n=1 Tax=Eumeta variegata TaxID=151549 RepID=A0A4C1TP66_EUMVA|nr:hypothetical protein EVAR_93944_1 [Eumeta japonica]